MDSKKLKTCEGLYPRFQPCALYILLQLLILDVLLKMSLPTPFLKPKMRTFCTST